MDTHKNARLTPEGREEMVCAVPEVRTIRRQARLHTSHPCIPAYAGNERTRDGAVPRFQASSCVIFNRSVTRKRQTLVPRWDIESSSPGGDRLGCKQ
jgi:hypothetical protein